MVLCFENEPCAGKGFEKYFILCTLDKRKKNGKKVLTEETLDVTVTFLESG
jgi:hypothetical protein